MEKNQSPSLLDYLTKYPEQDRVLAVVAFAQQAERLARSLELMIAGLYIKAADEDLSTDLRAVRHAAADTVRWFASNSEALLTYAKPKKAEPSEEKPVIH